MAVFTRENGAKVSEWFASIGNGLSTDDLATSTDRLLRTLFEGGSTVYSKAMDAAHIAQTAPGGSWHRLFDGGHDLSGAWSAIRGALPNDTITQELTAYVTELWKDVVTPNGLPLVTWDKTAFDSFSAYLESLLGVDSAWVKDAVSFTATETAGVAIAIGALLLNLQRTDPTRFARLTGSLAVSSAVAANPLLMAVCLVAMLRTASTCTNGAKTMANLKSIANGATVTGGLIGGLSLAAGAPGLAIGALGMGGVAGAWAYGSKRNGEIFRRMASEAFRTEVIQALSAPARNGRIGFDAAVLALPDHSQDHT